MNLKYALVALFLTACGPDWGDCKTCRPGEESAESVDGNEQIPVVVNVTVNVDQTQTQGQQQGQGQTQTQQPPVTSTPDAGPTPKPDAGTPDAGTPPVCRKVCTCTEIRYVCNGTGKDTNKKSDCKCGVKKTYTKCVKEETKCS